MQWSALTSPWLLLRLALATCCSCFLVLPGVTDTTCVMSCLLTSTHVHFTDVSGLVEKQFLVIQIDTLNGELFCETSLISLSLVCGG